MYWGNYLADADISPNPDPFNFWISESGYIKKTGIKIEGILELFPDMLRIHLFGQNPYEYIHGLESEYISFFAIEYNYPWRDMDLSPQLLLMT